MNASHLMVSSSFLGWRRYISWGSGAKVWAKWRRLQIIKYDGRKLSWHLVWGEGAWCNLTPNAPLPLYSTSLERLWAQSTALQSWIWVPSTWWGSRSGKEKSREVFSYLWTQQGCQISGIPRHTVFSKRRKWILRRKSWLRHAADI